MKYFFWYCLSTTARKLNNRLFLIPYSFACYLALDKQTILLSQFGFKMELSLGHFKIVLLSLVINLPRYVLPYTRE